MCHDLGVLLFSNVHTLRKMVIEMFFDSKIYYKCLKPNLALDVHHKLAPLLQIEDKTIPKFVRLLILDISVIFCSNICTVNKKCFFIRIGKA